jgi:hypothetical protein
MRVPRWIPGLAVLVEREIGDGSKDDTGADDQGVFDAMVSASLRMRLIQMAREWCIPSSEVRGKTG